jgi:hypothetical protein
MWLKPVLLELSFPALKGRSMSNALTKEKLGFIYKVT